MSGKIDVKELEKYEKLKNRYDEVAVRYRAAVKKGDTSKAAAAAAEKEMMQMDVDLPK